MHGVVPRRGERNERNTTNTERLRTIEVVDVDKCERTVETDRSACLERVRHTRTAGVRSYSATMVKISMVGFAPN